MKEYKILLGQENNGNQVFYTYIPYESRHILEQGISRSGKTNLVEGTIKGFCEIKDIEDKPNIVIIDPQSEFARLRKYNPNFIIIGDRGELDLNTEQARELGEQIRKQRLDVIIRISTFFDEDDRYQFISELVKGMLEVDQNYWLPTIFACDEVQKLANSKEKSPSRGAIATLLSTGLKTGITCIMASQGLKDVYTDVRNQAENRIIGFTKDPDSCEIAAELLDIPKTEKNIFRELGKIKGTFMASGIDISETVVSFRSIDMGWRTNEEKYLVYPKLSDEGLRKAERLRQSLVQVKVDKETMLRQEISRLLLRIEVLERNQTDDITKEGIGRYHYLRGWNDKHIYDGQIISEIREECEKQSLFNFFGKPKRIVVIEKSLADGRMTFTS